MLKAIVILLLLCLLGCSTKTPKQEPKNEFAAVASSQQATPSLYELKATSLGGDEIGLSQFKNKVILVINFSLRCGTTPQLLSLQKLYEQYKDREFTILGFPSDDFTGIEPKDPGTIRHICATQFGVTFPLFAMASVKGQGKDDIFAFLTQSGREEIQGEIGFNFEKFLIDRTGRVRERYGSFTSATSERVKTDLERLLAE